MGSASTVGYTATLRRSALLGRKCRGLAASKARVRGRWGEEAASGQPYGNPGAAMKLLLGQVTHVLPAGQCCDILQPVYARFFTPQHGTCRHWSGWLEHEAASVQQLSAN